MPSSKKIRGRKNRAGKPEASSTRKELDECPHGCPDPPPDGHAVYSFLECFFFREGNNKSGSLCVERIGRAVKECPEIIEDPSNRDITKSFMVSTGTNIIVGKEGVSADVEKMREVARDLAHAIIIFEDYERCQLFGSEPKLPMQAIRDLHDGGDRAITCFFAKRIPCSCLDEKKKKVKAEQKMGLCFNCNGRFAYSSLMECTGCGVAQYCSRECQVANWPKHKKGWPKCRKKAKSKAKVQDGA